MNERIKKLRENSLNTKETISIERARLLTEFYSSGESEKCSVPVSRAKAFKYILEHKELYQNPWQIFKPQEIVAPINEDLPDLARFEVDY